MSSDVPAWRAVRQRSVAVVRQPYWEQPDSSHLVRRWPDFTAACVATIFFWLSLTPSLVPRPWLLQGVVGGITASIGYGLGSIASTLARALLHWRPAQRTRARLWQAYWILGIVLSVVLITESAHAQRRLRELQGLPPSLTWHTPLMMRRVVVR
ncbi:alpha/beta-hydrolase N-terminal domain-containing protein [Streptomyces sp. NPDC050564]|uniref:alpha/beta-hydrolase N-terminal domain-containing protein n=1 Tax=Streptomyces sp. NPDC050564 TaxID=3365631 RepID=UPI003793F4CE